MRKPRLTKFDDGQIDIDAVREALNTMTHSEYEYYAEKEEDPMEEAYNQLTAAKKYYVDNNATRGEVASDREDAIEKYMPKEPYFKPFTERLQRHMTEDDFRAMLEAVYREISKKDEDRTIRMSPRIETAIISMMIDRS